MNRPLLRAMPSPEFFLGFIAASLAWLAIFALGLAAIRRHRRPDYGRVIIEPQVARRFSLLRQPPPCRRTRSRLFP